MFVMHTWSILLQVVSIADKQMQVLYQDRDAVVKNSDATHEEVSAFFRQLREALDQREKAVLSTVRKYTDLKLSTLDLHHQKFQEDHMAITGAVESLEKLLLSNETQLDCSLLQGGGALEEELELHQNSALGVCEALEESKLASRFLSFSGDLILLGESLREAGVLNECQRIPDTNILSMQRVVVSEQEDPYLLVPSRFEDLQTPREEVRIDGRKRSQRVMRMEDMVEDDDIQYQLPRAFVGSPTRDTHTRSLAEGLFQSVSPLKKVKQIQPVANGKVSPATIELQPQELSRKTSPEPAPRLPPLPPRRARHTAPVPPPRSATNHYWNMPPPLPPKPEEEEGLTEGGDLYDVPRSAMQGVGTPSDTYDVPRRLLQDDDTDIYSVPRSVEDTYDVPRNLLASSTPSPSHSSYQELHRLQIHGGGGDDEIYSVPKPTSPTEPLPPPRPPKPGSSSSISSSGGGTPLISSPPTPLLSPSPQGDFPMGVVPPRGSSPKPKPRTSSVTGFDYINTSIIIPGKASSAQQPLKTQQTLGSLSNTDIRGKPIPIPRPRRSQTFKEVPQSAPPTIERSKEKFRWHNGERRLTEAEKRMSTLPPDVKLGENKDSGHHKPLAVFTADQLARPMNDDQVYPCGVCCSPVTGLLVVTDVYNHCVRLLNPNTGRVVERIGREGRSGGNFKEPTAVVVDSNEHIFVAELDNPRVQKFTSRGKYLLKFGQKAFWGNQLHDPYGLALSPTDERLYITDWEKGRILVYHKDGRHSHTIGKDHAFLKFPAGLVFDRHSNLLVTDRGKHCVWVMSPEGKPISRIGKLGTGEGELLLPHGITVLNDDSIAVSESGNHRISIFAPNGRFIRSFGQKGSQPGMFHYPRHMCVDSKGHLVVADEHNQRIQIFNV